MYEPAKTDLFFIFYNNFHNVLFAHYYSGSYIVII